MQMAGAFVHAINSALDASHSVLVAKPGTATEAVVPSQPISTQVGTAI